MDSDGLTLGCAMGAEERAARKGGARTVRIGLAGVLGLPEGRLVSFGLAGALTDELACGDVIDASRVIDRQGGVLWEGEPLGVPGARVATMLAGEGVVDDPRERRALHERTGALAVDMESGPLARAGKLAGCVRVVSDTPARPLGELWRAVTPAGRVKPLGLVRVFLRSPAVCARAAADARRALEVAARAAEALA